MKQAILIFFSLAVAILGIGQEKSSPPPVRYSYFQMLYHTGVHWSRTEYLEEQYEDGYKAVEARFGFQSSGKKMWEQYSNYPRYGFGIHYADLVADKEDTIVGNPFSAFVFYGAPRIRFGKFSLNTDLSLGLSYTSLVHDPISNPFNDVIASHINLYLDFNVNLSFTLSNRLDMHAGYGVTHYSNGRIHEPQKGVNNWGWNFGLSYHFVHPPQHPAQIPEQNPAQIPAQNPDQNPAQIPAQKNLKKRSSVRPVFIHSEAPEFNPFQEIQFMYAAGVVDHHTLGDLEGIHYYASSFTADYAFTFHPRMAVTFGMDALYDGSLAQAIKGIPPDEVTTLQKMYFGSHLGYHFYINRVTILCNLGTYFLQHSNDRGYWFLRAGGRVRLTDHLQIHICIKTKNGIRADWIEWGLAYSLKIK
jgi:hypothetical protein